MGVEPTNDGIAPPLAGFEDRDDHRTACASAEILTLFRSNSLCDAGSREIRGAPFSSRAR